MHVHEVEPEIFVAFPNGGKTKVYRISTVETVIVRREDGSATQQDRLCEPYTVEVRPPELVLAWPQKEQEACGIFELVETSVPLGQRRVPGSDRFERIDGVVTRVWDFEDRPPPAPPTTKEERVAELAAQFGLTTDELRAVLGGTETTTTTT